MDDQVLPPMNNIVQPSLSEPVLSETAIGAQLVDVSQIIRQAIANGVQQHEKDTLIIRMEQLPMVCGNPGDLNQVFDSLISMIVKHPPANSKLFLYVKGEEEKKDPVVVFPDELRTFRISFYTNIVTDENWKRKYNRQLSDCRTLLGRQKGSFRFNEISNTGCLFILSLPGKIND